MNKPLLEAVAVSKRFAVGGGLLSRKQVLQAVNNVSLRVARGETLGLVGESGCGKSTLGRCLVRLQTVSDGEIIFEDTDITTLSMRALRKLRPRMQMVFQDPYASLNPRRRIGDLIAEPLRVHPIADGSRRDPMLVNAQLEILITMVGLKPEHLARYPHEFSGGQRQRIGIARALALDPDLVVADEPVSALDVSVQAQVINLMMDLQERLGLTYVFIAHDLAVVRQIATRTAVMYLGEIVEIGPTEEVFRAPAHPYTAALLAAVPKISATPAQSVVAGEVPSPLDPPSGCRFHPRCPRARARCRDEPPVLRSFAAPRQVACHFPM
jgi:peptide/nickel transport system ATP-binding protein